VLNAIPLYGRHRAYLRAVADGRAEMTCSSEPDLYIDGLACCDQHCARQLAEQNLITPACSGKPGQRVPAALTLVGTARVAYPGADPRPPQEGSPIRPGTRCASCIR
jgi:hypothetical protein